MTLKIETSLKITKTRISIFLSCSENQIFDLIGEFNRSTDFEIKSIEWRCLSDLDLPVKPSLQYDDRFHKIHKMKKN